MLSAEDVLKIIPPSSFRPIRVSLAFWPSADDMSLRLWEVGGKTNQSLVHLPIGAEMPSAESIWRSVWQYLGVRRSCWFVSSCGSTNSESDRGAAKENSGRLSMSSPMTEIGLARLGS